MINWWEVWVHKVLWDGWVDWSVGLGGGMDEETSSDMHNAHWELGGWVRTDAYGVGGVYGEPSAGLGPQIQEGGSEVASWWKDRKQMFDGDVDDFGWCQPDWALRCQWSIG